MDFTDFSKRSRLSVVVNGLEQVDRSNHYNGTHIVVEGGPQVLAVHRRLIVEKRKNGSDETTASRITWKGGSVPWEKFQFWEPRFVDGFSSYSEEQVSSSFIATPKYSFYHSSEYEGPPELAGVKLDWINCDIDIRYGLQEDVVDQWCRLPDGQKIVYGKDDPKTRKAEFGVFSLELDDGVDVGLEGITCRWNDTGIERCQKSLTMFKKAHTMSLDKVPVRLIEPVGMHPTLEIDLRSVETFGDDECEIFMYMPLPKGLFVDKFGNLNSDALAPFLLSGLTDLEAPSYQFRSSNNIWGSEILYRLRSNKLNRIELHCRYSEPNEILSSDDQSVEFHPILFEACDTGLETVAKNPFYMKSMGYEAYFTNDTLFRHFPEMEMKVKVPVAHWQDYQKTQLITGLCLLGSILYLLYKIFSQGRRNH